MTADTVAVGGARSASSGRILDRGAIFAGWVGIGMAVVIAISFGLIVAIQTLVFVSAPIAGLVIGAYANVRSARWRPIHRVFANAAYAGLVTGLTLALSYAALRLLFVFADAGTLPDGTTMACQMGPDCTYQRYVSAWPTQPSDDPAVVAQREAVAQAEAEQRRESLAAAGVTDGPSFGAYQVREQLEAGSWLVLLTLGGALVAAGMRSVRRPDVGSAGAASPPAARDAP
jgi:hypothetical protein